MLLMSKLLSESLANYKLTSTQWNKGTKEQKKHKCTSSVHGRWAVAQHFRKLPVHAGKTQISLGIRAV